jgi:hypothetical protein
MSISSIKPYKEFYNPSTGQSCRFYQDTKTRYKQKVRKLWNYVAFNFKNIKLAHFMLTDDSNGKTPRKEMSKRMNRVLQKIRDTCKSKNGHFAYVWTVERQKRGAIHYHLITLYDKAYIMPSPTDLGASWGLGHIIVVPGKKTNQYSWSRFGKGNTSWKPLFNYVSKYIGKDLGSEIEGKQFSGSNLPQIYKLRADRLQELLKTHVVGSLERMKCTYTRVWAIWAPQGKEIKRWLVKEFRSDWQYAGFWKNKDPLYDLEGVF